MDNIVYYPTPEGFTLMWVVLGPQGPLINQEVRFHRRNDGYVPVRLIPWPRVRVQSLTIYPSGNCVPFLAGFPKGFEHQIDSRGLEIVRYTDDMNRGRYLIPKYIFDSQGRVIAYSERVSDSSDYWLAERSNDDQGFTVRFTGQPHSWIPSWNHIEKIMRGDPQLTVAGKNLLLTVQALPLPTIVNIYGATLIKPEALGLQLISSNLGHEGRLLYVNIRDLRVKVIPNQ